eukprot:10639079-Lingulodinium_polyedra.AAC.1
MVEVDDVPPRHGPNCPARQADQSICGAGVARAQTLRRSTHARTHARTHTLLVCTQVHAAPSRGRAVASQKT